MKKISVDEDKDSTRKFKSSEIVRYYVDGGIKAKDNKGRISVLRMLLR